MAEQQKKKPQKQTEEQATEQEPVAAETTEALKGDLDEILDEIDEVLETNAEEFVRSYVQKGGQ